MSTRGQEIASVLKEQIKQFGSTVTMVDVGMVIEVGDGIARIHGLASAKYNELLEFPPRYYGDSAEPGGGQRGGDNSWRLPQGQGRR